MTKIAPSILSADFAALGDACVMLERCGADYVHLDVMDGVFVPNISFGMSTVRALRKCTALTLDTHLMITQPERYVEAFADAGADIITVHVEACVHIHRTMELIRNKNVRAGVSLNPGTPVSLLEPVLHLADLVLIMSVNPGFGGQSFISETLAKARYLRDYREQNGLNYEIEIDGGINTETAPLALEAGVDVLVSGNTVFTADDPAVMIRALRGE